MSLSHQYDEETILFPGPKAANDTSAGQHSAHADADIADVDELGRVGPQHVHKGRCSVSNPRTETQEDKPTYLKGRGRILGLNLSRTYLNI